MRWVHHSGEISGNWGNCRCYLTIPLGLLPILSFTDYNHFVPDESLHLPYIWKEGWKTLEISLKSLSAHNGPSLSALILFKWVQWITPSGRKTPHRPQISWRTPREPVHFWISICCKHVYAEKRRAEVKGSVKIENIMTLGELRTSIVWTTHGKKECSAYFVVSAERQQVALKQIYC